MSASPPAGGAPPPPGRWDPNSAQAEGLRRCARHRGSRGLTAAAFLVRGRLSRPGRLDAVGTVNLPVRTPAVPAEDAPSGITGGVCDAPSGVDPMPLRREPMVLNCRRPGVKKAAIRMPVAYAPDAGGRPVRQWPGRLTASGVEPAAHVRAVYSARTAPSQGTCRRPRGRDPRRRARRPTKRCPRIPRVPAWEARRIER